MKRRTILVITLCLIILSSSALFGCGSKATDDKLIKAGLESAAFMKEAVCSETYRNLMRSTIDDIEPDKVEVVSNADVSNVKAVYEINMDPETVLKVVRHLTDDKFNEYEDLSDHLQEKLISGAYTSLPPLINSRISDLSLSVVTFTGLFSNRDTFVCKSLKETRIFVFVFESGYPIWITYTPEVAGTVSYSSTWIVADCAQIDSEESFMKELHINTIPSLEVKKIR